MRELVTPDLDLIKQAKQGDVGVGEGRSRRSLAGQQDCNQCGQFAADLLQKQQTVEYCFNERL
jgi:hypothetical protein